MELGVDVLQFHSNGFDGKAELVGDLLVGQPLRQTVQNFSFSFRQAVYLLVLLSAGTQIPPPSGHLRIEVDLLVRSIHRREDRLNAIVGLL